MENEPTVFEKALSLMIWLVNQAACGNAYNQKDYWVTKAFEQAKEFYNADFWKEVFKLPKEERFKLGFRLWDKDSPGMLVPIWIIESLPDDFELETVSIMGAKNKILVKDLKDKDVRFGCVAYMV